MFRNSLYSCGYLLLQGVAILLLAGSLVANKDEIADNQVTVRFDRNGMLLEMTDWGNKQTMEVRRTIAQSVTILCSETPGDCNLENNSTFDSSDVQVKEGPKKYNGDVLMMVYVIISGGDVLESGNTYALPKEALFDAIFNNRDAFQITLPDKTVATMIRLDDESWEVPYDSTMDVIMISVSILVLVAACVLAIVLKCREGMSHKKMVESASGNKPSTASKEGEEEVTLTAIKPSPYKDEGTASEGKETVEM